MQATNERQERPLEDSPPRRAEPGQDAVASLDPRRNQPPGEAPRRERSGGAGGRKQVYFARKVFLLLGLLIFTLSRRPIPRRLPGATGLRSTLSDAGSQVVLDHLDRRPFSHDAAVLAARCLSDLDYGTAAEAYYHRGVMDGDPFARRPPSSRLRARSRERTPKNRLRFTRRYFASGPTILSRCEGSRPSTTP